jgi:hypothetical protein
MRLCFRRPALLLFFCVFGVPSMARADAPPIPIVLDWRSADACADADANYVLNEVTRLLHSPEAASTDRAVRAIVTMRPNANGWRADLQTETDGVRGSRTFFGGTCRAAAHAVALVLAIMINPEKVARHHEPEPEEAPRTPPPRSEGPTSSVATSSPVETAPPRAYRFSASILGSTDVGTMPVPSLGAGLAAGLLMSRLRFEILAMASPPRSAPLTDTPGVGARFHSFRGATRLCASILGGTIEVSPCLGAEFVELSGKGFGISSPNETTLRWGEASGGGFLRWAVSPHFGLRLEAIAQVPIQRRSFVMSGSEGGVPLGTVHTVPPVTSRLGLGMDVRF